MTVPAIINGNSVDSESFKLNWDNNKLSSVVYIPSFMLLSINLYHAGRNVFMYTEKDDVR